MSDLSAKDERQYEHVKDSATQGTGNPNANVETRTVDGLQNRAAELSIERRGQMTRDELVAAIREANG